VACIDKIVVVMPLKLKKHVCIRSKLYTTTWKFNRHDL